MTLPPRSERCGQCALNPGRDCWRCEAEEAHNVHVSYAEIPAELTALKAEQRDSLRVQDSRLNEMAEELKRYAIGQERPVMWSVYNAMHVRAATAEGHVEDLKRVIEDLRGTLEAITLLADPVIEPKEGLE